MIRSGTLYIIATPIGNLADITHRAVEQLRKVDRIAAEDTRHARILLNHYGINRPLQAYHDHNESRAAGQLIQQLQAGQSIALISDAGTPLISDPGYRLVQMARDAALEVVPIPGCCALIAALSVAGLATDRFSFEGFPPRTSSARQKWFKLLVDNSATVIFYESTRRLTSTLSDLAKTFPGQRQVVIARELTKLHETVTKTTVGALGTLGELDDHLNKGECVVLLEGAGNEQSSALLSAEHRRVLALVMREVSLKSAVAIVTEISGVSKKSVYHAALELRDALLSEG